jgi:hypothetical protein
MSTAKHEFEEAVRVNVHLVAEPGHLVGVAIAKIIAAAEVYAQASAVAATKGTLFEAHVSQGCISDRNTSLRFIREIREPLLATLPQGMQK